MYAAVSTRPDISLSVGVLSRFMADPKEEHWLAAKGVVRYLAGTADKGIVYSAGSNRALHGYGDADHGGCEDTRRSTTGYVFLHAGGAISWSSKRQPTVSTSTGEAEYVAAGAATKEALWLRHLSRVLQLGADCVTLFADNQSAIMMINNPVVSARTKHIDIAHHFVRERVARGEVKFHHCRTEDMVADCLTKPLNGDAFNRCVGRMGMR